MLTELTRYVVKEVGDGTTSAIILCKTVFDALCESIEFVLWYNRSEEDERGTGERSVIRSERKQDYEAGDDDGKFLSKKVSLESVQNDRRFCGSWNAGI